MKAHSRLLLLVGLAALLCACTPVALGSAVYVTGSGATITRQAHITGFENIHVHNGFRVVIEQSPSYSVLVRVDKDLEPYLLLERRGDTLEIGLQSGRTYRLTDATQEARITMPRLDSVQLSGASEATANGFHSARPVNVALSGSSEFDADIEAGDMAIQISGSSRVKLTGSGRNLTINASGNSGAELAKLAVADADITASGASTVVVHPSGRLSALASGASRVAYLGEPRLGATATSGSAVIKRR